MLSASGPIGVFDSGVGGLSVLRHIRAQLPDENLVYFADSGHAPYGSKPEEFVVDRSFRITDFLLSRQIKALVVACNTATATAIHLLRDRYPDLPIVGVEPGLKPAAAKKKASGAAVDSVWDAPVNENAYRERNIYYYEEDREGQVIGDFCIARGKYFWQTEEEFPLFLRSILQCSKELLDEADTALGRLKSPSKRTLIQAADPKASDGSKHIISHRSRAGYQSLHLWLRLKEDASPLPPENLNLQISRLLEQYKNAPS